MERVIPSGIGLGFSVAGHTEAWFQTIVPHPPAEVCPKTQLLPISNVFTEAEVSRIWYAQRSSLTVDNHVKDIPLKTSTKSINQQTMMNTSRVSLKKRRRIGSKMGAPQSAKRNVLKITRLVRDENDVVQRKVEYVHDPPSNQGIHQAQEAH